MSIPSSTWPLRFGKNGYSALTWYDGADPRPDYYRYMPSYKLLNATDLEAASMAAASLADQWMRNVGNIRHFDWDEMYQTNMNFRNAEDEAIYGPGARSNYIIEERHTDQLDWNLAAQISRIYKDNSGRSQRPHQPHVVLRRGEGSARRRLLRGRR